MKIESLEEFEAQPVMLNIHNSANVYDTKEILLEDIVKKINEIIEHLNNNKMNIQEIQKEYRVGEEIKEFEPVYIKDNKVYKAQEIQDFEKTFGNDEIVSVGHSGSRVFEVTEEKLKSFISQKLKEQRQELLKSLEPYETYNPDTGEYDIYSEVPKKVLIDAITK